MEFIIKKTKEEIALDVARTIVDEVKNNPKAVLGLATGSSPIESYKKIIELSKNEGVTYKDVTTFNLDEYIGLSADDEMSYRYFMNKNLFEHLDFIDSNHHFPTMDNFKTYDETIASFGGIDIQLLGIGSNGHIAFNEPGTDLNSLTHVTDLDKKTIEDNSRFFASIDDVPKKAYTMGLKSILNAKKIILIATGKNKAEAIKKLKLGEYNPMCPATSLNLKNKDVYIYLDEDAASLIK